MASSNSAHLFAPFVLVLFSAISFTLVDATTPGAQGEAATEDVMDSQALRSALLSELMSALGGGHRVTEDRLSGIETSLGPMWASLSKNEHGRLDQPAVRYVLHRLFVQRHGMFLKGLEPVQTSNSSSISGILDSEVPSHVMGLLEERVGGRGFGIHEIAVLAATLEHVIHDEAIERLKSSYAALGLFINDKATEEEIVEAIEVYMVLFVRGKNYSAMDREEVLSEKRRITLIYATWPATQKWVAGVRRDVINAAGMADPLTFDTTSRVVEEIGERYGRFQDIECRDLKAGLVKAGDQGVGRILLKDFYAAKVNGSSPFTESVDYLRQLGALDESDPARVSVILPNYINSPTNCLATASIFKVCCIDECEAILGHLEREVSAPDAVPERIVQIISHLSSATGEAPRALPSSLVSRLDDVARHHSGRVPLHGRLFSQWLSHVYPRECPFPHVAGTIRPQTAAEWLAEGNSARASSKEIKMVSQERESRSPSKQKKTAQESLQWVETEELYVYRPPSKRAAQEAPAAPARSSWTASCGGFVLLAAVVAMGLGFKDTIMSALLSSNHSGAKMSRACLPHSHSV